MDINLGDRLKELRKEKKLTQDDLCNNLNKKFNTTINKGMISKWENSKEQPRLEYIINIADYFNIDISYLLGFEEKKYTLPYDEIRKIINNFLPNITDLVKSICIKNGLNININIKNFDEFYTKLSLKIVDEISRIDFYDAYDIWESEVYQSIEKYCNISNAQDIFKDIKRDIININIFEELKIVIKEAYDDDDFYGLDLRKSIFENVNDEHLTETIVSSIYNSKTMEDILYEISKLFETNYFNIIIKEILNELLAKLNLTGTEKVIDYIRDLLSNDKYKKDE